MSLDLSADAYWLLAIAVVALYLVLWVTHFDYVYGWSTDDRTVFAKGMATVRDWKNAFSFFNALQPYFFVISYLPLASGLTLPSIQIPWSGHLTPQFRFFLLYAVYVHAVILLGWAWLAPQLVANRVAALLSLLLFATSPTLMLWSPEPESRLFGLPFAFLGIWLLLRLSTAPPRGAWRVVGMAFAAGSLFGLAQAIHYTALYLLAPFCAVYWGVALWRGWRARTVWLGLVAFAVGGLWLQALMEYLSYAVVGYAWADGPLMTLLKLRDIHRSHFSVAGNLAHWVEWIRSQFGWPLMVASVVGAVVFWRAGASLAGRGRLQRAVLPLTVLLGLVYIWLSGTMPFFRQTSVLQPFLFLFAAVAVVYVAQQGTRWPRGRLGVALGLLGVIAIVPWVQAQQVFQAHQGLGRTLRSTAAPGPGSRGLEWLRIAWYDDNNIGLTSVEDLEQAAPDTRLATYFPFQFLTDHPSWLPYLQRTQPVAAWPTLWATDAVRAELASYWVNSDWRYNPVMSEARLYRVGDLLAQRQGQPLAVAEVTADSVASPSFEPVNVFDQDRSPDGTTGWLSANTPMPHWLAARFTQPVSLGEVDVVLPPTERSTSRINALQVQIADEGGAFHTVWRGQDLAGYPAVTARWAPQLAAGLRLVVEEQLETNGPTNQAVIEEVAFPGYQVTAPRPARPFADLQLTEVRANGSDYTVVGTNLTPQTTLVLDGVRLARRPSNEPDRFVALRPKQAPPGSGETQGYLSDGLRQSNVLTVNVAPAGFLPPEPLVPQASPLGANPAAR